jgi:hypothetical protein
VLAISRLPWAKFSRELHRFAHGYITCLASLSSPALLPCMGQVVPPGAVCQARALLSDLGGKVVAFRRQNRVRQLKDTWPIGFSRLYMSVRSIGR